MAEKLKTQLEKDLNQLKVQFTSKIDSYVSAIDEAFFQSIKQLDEKQRYLKKTNEDLLKYRIDVLVYQ